ncbi:regulator of Vps4 activity in the MVB pathway-domain-containing protein [Kockovaella imperatae]|uniref:Regulator of Vps4 activity in the MVB pathway-domain-containing protein n=1 Tax=Kockovaella imperatae TaxID=4999 RepID=A0A1Y1UKI1_9TREE|nr:regulator of Vps4 activity in the MVB pathway-domain-containing protein [Kockovaella imperatae]ORX38047.1 regulator of Vps4 activity in the MVB pathway-domain-containing protein [Kockovaella imperatae]
MVPWNGARTKVQIRLSIQRLRTLQEKKLALAKKSRREIADLLLKGRVETAKLRVEGLIQDDIYVELLEILELYSEKLQARFGLLDASTGEEPESSIADAVCAIVYAAPRTELKELQVLREMLMHKYGRNFSLTLVSSDPPPSSVPPRVLSKLALFTPAQELVDAYLYEIAKGYGVDWAPDGPIEEVDGKVPSAALNDGTEGGDDDEHNGHGGGTKEAEKAAVPVANESGKKSPSPLPRDKEDDRAEAPASQQPEPKKKVNDDDELAKRFERLKNLK